MLWANLPVKSGRVPIHLYKGYKVTVPVPRIGSGLAASGDIMGNSLKSNQRGGKCYIVYDNQGGVSRLQ
mgnify:CR=1 FL=1